MILFTLLTDFLLLFLLAIAAGNDGDFASSSQMVVISIILLLMIECPQLFGLTKSGPPKQPPSPHQVQTHRTVMSIFGEMGPHYIRQAYQMDESDFWKLHMMLRPYMEKQKPRSGKKKHKDGAKNGLIPMSSRLSCTLRYFAGGLPYDISVIHGMSHTELFASVWNVVNAVNSCDELAFRYLTDHTKQREIGSQGI